MPICQPLLDYRRYYTPSLPGLAPQPGATKRASFHGTTKQCLFSFLLCNALTRCDLSIRLVDILQQFESFNQPIILPRIQNDGSTASPLCEHEGTLVPRPTCRSTRSLQLRL